jgi:drug/metabolite transporter (DMT)-like permease
MALRSLLLLIVSALAAAGGQLLLKVGAQARHQFLDFLNVPIALGLSLYGLSTIIWIYTLSSEKLVNVFAFTGLTFVLVYLGGTLLLGETITKPAVVGVLLVLLGIYLIGGYG